MKTQNKPMSSNKSAMASGAVQEDSGMASGGFREAARAWSRTAGSVQSPPSRNRARSWEGFKSPTIGASTYSKWGYHDFTPNAYDAICSAPSSPAYVLHSAQREL
jgi:hypothetical protein